MKRFGSLLVSVFLSFSLALNSPLPTFSPKNLAPLTKLSLPQPVDSNAAVTTAFHEAVLRFFSEKENEFDNRYAQLSEHSNAFFETELNDRIFSAISSLGEKEREAESGLYTFLKKWKFQPNEVGSYVDELGKKHLFLFFVSKENFQLLVREIVEGSNFYQNTFLTLPKVWPAGILSVLESLHLDKEKLSLIRQNLLAAIIRQEGKISLISYGHPGLHNKMQVRWGYSYSLDTLKKDLQALTERDSRFEWVQSSSPDEEKVLFLSPPDAAKKRLEKIRKNEKKIKDKEVVFFQDLSKESVAIAGGKGANLGELGNVPGISVPQGLVITASSYQRFIQEAKVDTGEDIGERTLAQIITDELAQIDYSTEVSFFKASDNIRSAFLQAFRKGKMPESIRQSIEKGFQKLAVQIKGREISSDEFNQMSWAIRSSGTREDLEDASSAGQQATFLNVRGMENILEKVVEDWASLWTGRAIAYRNGQIMKSFLRQPQEEGEPGTSIEEFQTIKNFLGDRNTSIIQSIEMTRDPLQKVEAMDHKVIFNLLTELNKEKKDLQITRLLERFQKYIDDFTDPKVIEIAVVGQRQVKSTRAFTLLSLDPSTGWLGMTFNRIKEMLFGKARVWRIEFNYGLGESLVGGEVTPDSFLIHKVGNKYKIIERTIGAKANQMLFVEDLLQQVNLDLEQGKELAQAVQYPFLLKSLNLDDKQISSISKAVSIYLESASDKGINYAFLDFLPFSGLIKERKENGNNEDDQSRLKLIAEQIKKIWEVPSNVKIKVDPTVLKRLAGSDSKKDLEAAQEQLIMLAYAVKQSQEAWRGAEKIAQILGIKENIIPFVQALADLSKEPNREKIKISSILKDNFSSYSDDQWIALAHALKALTQGAFTILTFTPKELQKRACVTDEEVIAVAKAGERIQNHYNHVVDVEGAFDPEGRVQIVQARPVTTKKETDDPDRLQIKTMILSKEAEKLIEGQKKKSWTEEQIKEKVRKGDLEPLKGFVLASGLGTRNAFSGNLVWIDEEKGNLAQQLAQIKKKEKGKQGDIILTRFTSPDYVEAMKRSSGVISIEGGATSHAAIVSRELGIATIVGVGNSIPKWVFELLEERIKIPVTIDANKNSETGQKTYLGVLPTEESLLDISISELEELWAQVKEKNNEANLKFGLIGANPNSFKEISKITQFSGHYGVNLARIEFIVADMGVHQKALQTLDFQTVREKAARRETLTLNELKVLAILRSRITDRRNVAAIDRKTEVTQAMEEKLVGYRSGVDYFKSKITQGLSSIAATHTLDQNVVVRGIDFKTNEMGELIGGKLFEKNENAPMIGERGLQREIDPANEVLSDMFLEAFQEAVDDGYTNLSLMYPIVRHPDHLRDIIRSMKRKGVRPKSFGIMVEIPSNVWLVDEFAAILKEYQKEMKALGHEMDVFFSFGTNDLTQLTLGIGRDNARLKHLFRESNDAVVRSIIHVAKAAKRYGIKMGLCGNAVNALIEELTNLEKEPEKNKEQIQILERTIKTIFLNLDSVGVDISNYKKAVQRAAKYLMEKEKEVVAYELVIPNQEPQCEILKEEKEEYIRQNVDQVMLELQVHPKALLDFDEGKFDAENPNSPVAEKGLNSLYLMSMAQKMGIYEGEIKSAKELFQARIRDGIIREGLQGKRVVHGTTYAFTLDPNPENPYFAHPSLMGGKNVYEKNKEDNPPLDFTGMSRNLDPEYLELFKVELKAVKEAALQLQNKPNTKPIFLQLNCVRTAQELQAAFKVIAEIGLPENVKIGLGVHKASNSIVIDQMAQLKIPDTKKGLSFVHMHATRLVQEMMAADMYHDKIWLTQEQVEDVLQGPRRVLKQAALNNGWLYLEDALSQSRPAKGKIPEEASFRDQIFQWKVLGGFLKNESGKFQIGSIRELNTLVQDLRYFYIKYQARIAEDPKNKKAMIELAESLKKYYEILDIFSGGEKREDEMRQGADYFRQFYKKLKQDGIFDLNGAVVSPFFDPLNFDLSRRQSAVEVAI